jgi:transposase-like protein
MNPDQINEARQSLGLSVSELARLLDTDQQSVRRWMMAADKATHRPVPARVGRLVQAYLDGYRPDDWP